VKANLFPRSTKLKCVINKCQCIIHHKTCQYVIHHTTMKLLNHIIFPMFTKISHPLLQERSHCQKYATYHTILNTFIMDHDERYTVEGVQYAIRNITYHSILNIYCTLQSWQRKTIIPPKGNEANTIDKLDLTIVR